MEYFVTYRHYVMTQNASLSVLEEKREQNVQFAKQT
jgi:hypothetical protein